MLLVSVLSLLLIVSHVEHEKRMLGSQKITKRAISKESARRRYYCACWRGTSSSEAWCCEVGGNMKSKVRCYFRRKRFPITNSGTQERREKREEKLKRRAENQTDQT